MYSEYRWLRDAQIRIWNTKYLVVCTRSASTERNKPYGQIYTIYIIYDVYTYIKSFTPWHTHRTTQFCHLDSAYPPRKWCIQVFRSVHRVSPRPLGTQISRCLRQHVDNIIIIIIAMRNNNKPVFYLQNRYDERDVCFRLADHRVSIA